MSGAYLILFPSNNDVSYFTLKWSKVHYRSLNLFDYVIPVLKFVNRSFRSSNLFGCVILVLKLINHMCPIKQCSATLRLWGTRLVPYSRGEWPWSMNWNERQTVAWEWLDSGPSVCVRFTLQGWKFGSKCSAAHGYWDCLISLPHIVRSGTMMILNHVRCK